MKKAALILSLLLLTACSDGVIGEQTDTLPTTAEMTEIIALPETQCAVFDLMNTTSGDVYDGGQAYSVEIRHCGSADLSFLADTGCRELTIYGFTGRADDYAELFGELSPDKLYIYTAEGCYFEEDRKTYLSRLSKDCSFVYTDTNVLNICGNDYLLDDHAVMVSENISDEDIANIARLGDVDIELVSDNISPLESILPMCPNVTAVSIGSFSGDMSRLLQLIAEYDISDAEIWADLYSESDAVKLLNVSPTCSAFYRANATPESISEDGTGFYASPAALIPEKDIELTLFFTNGTGHDIIVNDLRISRTDGTENIPISFSDGTFSFSPELTVPYGGSENTAAFILTEDIFSFSSCPQGIYYLTASMDNAEYSFPIIITQTENQTAPVLTDADEDAAAAFSDSCKKIHELEFDYYVSEEYADSHTPDEYIAEYCGSLSHDFAEELLEQKRIIRDGVLHPAAGGGRGTDIYFCGAYFDMIRPTDNEIIIRCTAIYHHDDLPYNADIMSMNMSMIQQDGTWKTDSFRMYY